MDYQIKETNRLTEPASQHQIRAQNYEFGDDECSIDSGCSSGGSTGSAERLSRQSSGDRLYESKPHCYLERLRGRSSVSWAHERLSRKPSASGRTRCSKSWSPKKSRSHSCGESPLHSDSHSSDSETNSQLNSLNSLLKVFHGLKISRAEPNEKKHSKKSPKRILRTPVFYTYMKGLSGLPTQRVPRYSTQHHSQMLSSCQEFGGLY